MIIIFMIIIFISLLIIVSFLDKKRMSADTIIIQAKKIAQPKV